MTLIQCRLSLDQVTLLSDITTPWHTTKAISPTGSIGLR
jgi:hypothetical protein